MDVVLRAADRRARALPALLVAQGLQLRGRRAAPRRRRPQVCGAAARRAAGSRRRVPLVAADGAPRRRLQLAEGRDDVRGVGEAGGGGERADQRAQGPRLLLDAEPLLCGAARREDAAAHLFGRADAIRRQRAQLLYAARRSGLRALRAQASRAPCAQANEPASGRGRLDGVLHDPAEAQAARARRRRDRAHGRVDVRPRHRARRRGGERRRRVGGGRRRRPVRCGVDVRRRAVRRPRERPPRCGARPAPRRHHGDVAQ